MITVAFDAASDRCTVAATDGTRIAHRALDGARGHAGAILSLLDEVLGEMTATPRDIGSLVTGDGPGSFTGLRVVASVAKALAWGRKVEWRTAPSLLIRAAGHAPPAGGVVLAVSDALRGELYAGCWRIAVDAVVPIAPAPCAMRPEALAQFGAVDVVVGSIPPALLEAVQSATRCEPVTGDTALPDARHLLALAARRGGTTPVSDAAAWEPEYGRPAEAQAVWERTHGRRLPSSRSLVG